MMVVKKKDLYDCKVVGILVGSYEEENIYGCLNREAFRTDQSHISPNFVDHEGIISM